MSARFVSTGAIDTKTGDAVALPTQPASTTTTDQKNDEWAAVQLQLQAERQAREAKRKAAALGEGGGKSLYEVLEANKAAKQAAFEEANKIRNQFRALDEDEIGFLEEVEMRKREEAERGRREMEEGLKVFREARKGERKEDEGEEAVVVEGGWKVGGKRKRRKGEGEVSGLLKGVKRRTSSGGAGGNSNEKDGKGEREAAKDEEEDENGEAEEEVGLGRATDKKKKKAEEEPAVKAPVAAATPPPADAAPKSKLGLVDYGSDSDDE